MQISGACFLIFGFIIIIANKIEFNLSLIPSTPHSIIGFIAILLLIFQSIIGQQKLNALDINNKKINRWHGDFGLLLWDIICLSLLSGLISFLYLNFTNLLVELSVVAVWLTVHAQLKNNTTVNTSKDLLTSIDIITMSNLKSKDDDNLISNNNSNNNNNNMSLGGFEDEDEVENESDL
jgi:hypothetical protein